MDNQNIREHAKSSRGSEVQRFYRRAGFAIVATLLVFFALGTKEGHRQAEALGLENDSLRTELGDTIQLRIAERDYFEMMQLLEEYNRDTVYRALKDCTYVRIMVLDIVKNNARYGKVR